MNCPGRAPSRESAGRPRRMPLQGISIGSHGTPDPDDRILRDVWSRMAAQLRDTGAPDAEIEAEVLLRCALGLDRAKYFAALNQPVPPKAGELAAGYAKRRAEGEPLAYITGMREFYGLEIMVDQRVLVPRQETELLVDLALAACVPRCERRKVIADVGTGSGAIAVALASQLPVAFVYAIDASAGALEMAGANAERHGVRGRVELLRGDLLGSLPEPADVIVSNPPYIPTRELPDLPRDVRREPSIALDGGLDGLAVIARLLEQAPKYLKPGGSLFMEMAPDQRSAATRMAGRCFPRASIEAVRDDAGQHRVLSVRQVQGTALHP